MSYYSHTIVLQIGVETCILAVQPDKRVMPEARQRRIIMQEVMLRIK